MIESYDPSHSYGTHTIRVTIQQWACMGTLTVKIGGNVKGLPSLVDSIADTIYDSIHELESDCNFKILEDDNVQPWFNCVLRDNDGNKLEIEDELDELENFIIAMEITDFQREAG